MTTKTCLWSKSETVPSRYEPGKTYERHTALCGRDGFRGVMTDKPERVDCPKCSAKLAKDALADKPHLRLGDAVREPLWLRSHDLRSAYPVYVREKLLGYVGIKAGWGRPWRVYRVDYDGSIGGMIGMEYRSEDQFKSKGAAILGVERYVEEGRLYTREGAEAARVLQLEADRKKREVEEAKRLADKEASEREAAELASIALLDLTTAQMDALKKAYRARFFRLMPALPVEAGQ